MTIIDLTSDTKLLSRVVGRLRPYLRDDTLRRSRLERVLDSLGLTTDERTHLTVSLLAALEKASILLVEDRAPDGPAPLENRDLGGAQTVGPSDEAASEDDPPVVVEPVNDHWPAEHELADAERLLDEINREVEEPGPGATPSRMGMEQDCIAATADEGAAVEAARRFLVHRRRLRNPSNVLLTAQQEAGLALLLRPPGIPWSDLPEDYRTRLADSSEAALAFDALVVHNMRLSWSIAKRHVGQSDLDLEDLAAYGFLGLIRAVQKFDVRLGYKFSTYATWWIRQSITRSIMDCGRAIRLPVHIGEKINKVRAARARLDAQGAWPTLSRLAHATGYTEEEVRRLLTWMRGCVSYDMGVGEDGTPLLEFHIDRSDIAAEDPVIRKAIREEVQAVLATLTDRERKVIELRFGFLDDEQWTLDRIGAAFDLTRERIRQIEGKTLAKLRHVSRSASLRELLDLTRGDSQNEPLVLEDVIHEIRTFDDKLLHALTARVCDSAALRLQPILLESSQVAQDARRLVIVLHRIVSDLDLGPVLADEVLPGLERGCMTALQTGLPWEKVAEAVVVSCAPQVKLRRFRPGSAAGQGSRGSIRTKRPGTTAAGAKGELQSRLVDEAKARHDEDPLVLFIASVRPPTREALVACVLHHLTRGRPEAAIGDADLWAGVSFVTSSLQLSVPDHRVGRPLVQHVVDGGWRLSQAGRLVVEGLAHRGLG